MTGVDSLAGNVLRLPTRYHFTEAELVRNYDSALEAIRSGVLSFDPTSYDYGKGWGRLEAELARQTRVMSMGSMTITTTPRAGG